MLLKEIIKDDITDEPRSYDEDYHFMMINSYLECKLNGNLVKKARLIKDIWLPSGSEFLLYKNGNLRCALIPESKTKKSTALLFVYGEEPSSCIWGIHKERAILEYLLYVRKNPEPKESSS